MNKTLSVALVFVLLGSFAAAAETASQRPVFSISIQQILDGTRSTPVINLGLSHAITGYMPLNLGGTFSVSTHLMAELDQMKFSMQDSLPLKNVSALTTVSWRQALNIQLLPGITLQGFEAGIMFNSTLSGDGMLDLLSGHTPMVLKLKLRIGDQ